MFLHTGKVKLMSVKKNIYLLVILSIVLQGCGVKARIKKADRQFELGEYYSAGDIYRSVYGRISGKDRQLRSAVAFKQAESHMLTNYSVQAERAYLNSLRNDYADSIVYLRYAQALHRNGKYAEAIKNYTIYLQNDSASLVTKNGIEGALLAEKMKAEPSDYKVKKADIFNQRRSSTFSPAFAGSDNDMLFFTSTRQFNKKIVQKSSSITGAPVNKIFYVRKNAAGKWEKPEVIGSEVNEVITDDGVCSFSPDGKTMYITRASQSMNTDAGSEIFASTRAGGAWSEPKKIKFFADSTISVAHPAIAPDGETIYFVSDAPNGYGGKDIWKGKLAGDECKYIENPGPAINTPGDEMFPVVKNENTLYFSSNGHPGLGGLDIYKAVKQKDETWIVTNEGIPLNSNADDFGMAFESKGERGYFSSNRGEPRGYDMLWSFELPESEFVVEGKVTDEQQNPIPDAVVRLVSNSGLNARVVTRKDGSYRIKLEKDIECVMMASARGYLNSEGKLSTTGIKDSKAFSQDFRLTAIYKPIPLNNIFYEFGKWDLTPESVTGLSALIKILRDNPNIVIELSAHTDFKGDNASNKLLSERRAKSVVDYLIAEGISPDRLTSVGYGEEKPFEVDANTSRIYPFLKENDVLTEQYILKLTPEQQDIANQINRRTEFKVIRTNYR